MALQFYVCTVVSVGLWPVDRGPGSEVSLVLTDTAPQPGFQDLRVTIPSQIGDQALAVALTSVSTGLRVSAWLEELHEPDGTELTMCEGLEVVTAS